MEAPPTSTGPDGAHGGGTLVLVPTSSERSRLVDEGGLEPDLGRLELCGFGPIAAAARTATLCAELRPARVLLVGIAGTYDTERHPVGTAMTFGTVALDGIGVGEGERLVTPPALGFPQWPGSSSEAGQDGGVDPIYDRVPLSLTAESELLLLTTCAASDSPAHAAERRERFPDAAAEDMEGFAVATACRLAGIPVGIVRGISNQVGDRDPKSWRIPAALAAARQLADRLLRELAAADAMDSGPAR